MKQFTHQIKTKEQLIKFVATAGGTAHAISTIVGLEPFSYEIHKNGIAFQNVSYGNSLLMCNTQNAIADMLDMFRIDIPIEITEHTINDKVHELFVKFKERLLAGDFNHCDDNTIEFKEAVILKFIINNNRLAGITVQTDEGYRNDIFKSKHCEILYNLYSDAVIKKKNELNKKYQFMNNIKM